MALGEILERVEAEEGPGPVLFVLTLPVLLPTPPGVSMLLALPLVMVAPQIMVGRRRIWIPRILSGRQVERKALSKVAERLLSPLSYIERFVRPRLQVLTGRVGASLVGFAATIIAIVLILPIPAANLVPSIALVLFALGLTRRDGLLVIAGYAVLVLAAAIIGLAVAGVRFGVGHIHF